MVELVFNKYKAQHANRERFRKSSIIYVQHLLNENAEKKKIRTFSYHVAFVRSEFSYMQSCIFTVK